MTDDEMRIAIAEACGWRFVPEHDRMSPGGHETAGYPESWINPAEETADLPDYLNDLNAMHEAVMDLRRKSSLRYVDYTLWLSRIIARDAAIEDTYPIPTNDAKTRQRAEAFLKAVGGWKE